MCSQEEGLLISYVWTAGLSTAFIIIAAILVTVSTNPRAHRGYISTNTHAPRVHQYKPIRTGNIYEYKLTTL